MTRLHHRPVYAAAIALLAIVVAILVSSLLSFPRSASPGVTDLATEIPTQDKAVVTVLHPDCRFENFLVPPEQVVTFISSLPAADRVTVVVEPQGRSAGKEPPRATVYPGTEPSDCQTRIARTSRTFDAANAPVALTTSLSAAGRS